MLGKSDFKALLKWRLKMKEYRDALTKAAKKAAGEDDDDDDKDAGTPSHHPASLDFEKLT